MPTTQTVQNLKTEMENADRDLMRKSQDLKRKEGEIKQAESALAKLKSEEADIKRIVEHLESEKKQVMQEITNLQRELQKGMK